MFLKLFQATVLRPVQNAAILRFNRTMYLNDEEYVDEGVETFKLRPEEPTKIKRSRLLYQSRKRGTLEIGLLLSQFSGQYLGNMTRKELDEYDVILNRPSNDWEILGWIFGQKPVPDIYKNDTFFKLVEFAKNEKKELRYFQPDVEIYDK